MPKRLLIDVPLEPAIGSRFQPTGFPDIGHAEFRRPSGERSLLVESAQSMANRLEGTAWDDGTDAPLPLFDGLPYVRVVGADGRYLTSSRTEAHRLAAAFVKDAKLNGTSMVDEIKRRLGLRDDTPISMRAVAAAVFALDPFCLVHGVFFADSKWPGQPKIARAVGGFVEAHEVEPAYSGGVKKDHVRHALGDQSGGGTAEGYGTVPYQRTEWTAASITASFSVDLQQFASYGLGEPAAKLLEAIALWEIRTLVENGLRLRTACDLEPTGPLTEDKRGTPIPSLTELEQSIRSLISACQDQLGTGAAMDVVWDGASKKAKKDGS
jgi:CRISPR-associated protein Csb1